VAVLKIRLIGTSIVVLASMMLFSPLHAEGEQILIRFGESFPLPAFDMDGTAVGISPVADKAVQEKPQEQLNDVGNVVGKSATAAAKLTVDGYSVVTTGPAPYMFSAAGFICASGSDAGCLFNWNAGAIGHVFDVNSQSSCYYSQVPIPSGASLAKMDATITDNNTNSDLVIVLRRVNTSDQTIETIASLVTDSANDDPALQELSTTAFSKPDILYPDNYYFLYTCLGLSQSLQSVRLYVNPE